MEAEEYFSHKERNHSYGALRVLLRRKNDVVSLPLAQQEMLPEKQIVDRDVSLRVRFTNIIYVYATAFNILSRLAFRGTQTRVQKRFDQDCSRPIQLVTCQVFRRDLAHNFVEGVL